MAIATIHAWTKLAASFLIYQAGFLFTNTFYPSAQKPTFKYSFISLERSASFAIFSQDSNFQLKNL